MFFEQVVLQRKGPLGMVWLACHYEKKLTKAQVAETDIEGTTELIKKPKAPMALRLSGHLLLGVVRIYCKKVDFLYTDSAEALVKIKMSFRPGVVDMEQSVVNANAITLPETFGDFELLLPGDIATDLLPNAEEGLFTLNVAKAVDITMHPDIDQMRGGSQYSKDLSQPSFPSSQHELSSINPENDLLDPFKAQQSFELAQGVPQEFGMEIELNLPPQGFDENVLQQPWFPSFGDSSSSDHRMDIEKAKLDIPDLLSTPKAPQSRLKTKKYPVDRKTQLADATMKALVNDPEPLLRNMARAPPTRALLNRELNATPTRLFEVPSNNLKVNSKLNRVLTRGHKSRGNMSAPEGTFSSDSPPDDQARDLSTTNSSHSPEELDEPKQGRKRTSKEAEVETEFPVIDMGFDEFPRYPSYETIEPYESTGYETVGQHLSDYSSQFPDDTGDATRSGQVNFVVTKRTKNMHTYLDKQFDSKQTEELSFNQLFPTTSKSRNTVAIAFFEILGIKSKNCIDVKQKSAYDDIIITKTDEFSNLKQTVV